jgi:hypothetical protein
MADLYGDPNLSKRKPQPQNAGDLAGPTFGGDETIMGPPPVMPPPLAAQSPPSAPAAPQATSRPPTAPIGPPPPTNDPFASMGGGVQLSGGEWVPKDHPLAQQAQPVAPGGIATAPPVAPPAAAAGDPFTAMGGGVKLPTGEWVPKDHPLAQPQAPTALAAAQAPAAPLGSSLTPPQAPPAAPGDLAGPQAQSVPPAAPTVNTAFKDALLAQLGVNQQAPSLNDPALKGQSDAFALAQTRSRDAARSALAERMAQEGGPGVNSGAFNQDLAGLFQQQGEAEGAFNANLVGKELQNRRDQLVQYMTMAGNQMNAEEARSLQKQLADIDAGLKQQGMSQQESQFGRTLGEQGRQFDKDAALKQMGITTQADLGGRDLSLRDKLGSGQLNLGLLSQLMQNDQFGKNLGANLGMFNSNQNQTALLNMLNGL